jgi:hypothetical protein
MIYTDREFSVGPASFLYGVNSLDYRYKFESLLYIDREFSVSPLLGWD